MLTQTGGSFVSILIKGGLVMVPLLISSILSLAVILERLFVWRRVGKAEGGETILSLVAAGHLAQAMKVARASQHPVARVLLAGLEHQYPAPSMALVFFMLSTLSMTINRGLPVNLPKAASSQKDRRESFNITVTREGDIFLNKEPVALHDIAQRVQTGLAKDPELLAVINADDQAIHGTIVDVMDKIRLAGVSRLAIAVKPERRGTP